MQFRIADTFTESPRKLTGQEQKPSRTPRSSCKLDPANPGMQLHRCVTGMGGDDEVIPLQSRIETVADESELKEVYNTERHWLYVACTRVRHNPLITAVAPAPEFLDDLKLA